jgi:poly-gamma-glutamate system protein
VALSFWLLLQWLAPPEAIPWTAAMRTAAVEMDRSLEMVRAYCREAGIPVDSSLDPNGTCLIGPRYTPLFTTLGQLEAKRSALNPDVAGLLAHLLSRAGVSAGDTVAVGASGSFPGFLLATLAAVKALRARPVTILSLGASSFGATRPDFHLLDLYRVLHSGGLVDAPPAAVSLGGEGDAGGDFPPNLVDDLRADAALDGAPILEEAVLEANVARRMALYGRPKAFVNLGGAEANLGTDPVILEVPPGLVRPEELPDKGEVPPPARRGVLMEMAVRGVPVIHLLHVRGLVLAHGLAWDPVPLPAPGTTPLRRADSRPGWRFWLLTVAFLGALAGIFPLHDAKKASIP